MTKRTVRDMKAQATHDAAMSIIDREKAVSAAKIARLRTLREAQPPLAEAAPKRARRGKAIPVSRLNAQKDG